ncbi:MAG: sugar-binding protein [Thermobacillus sp. ZCTH02-B1]|uniref:ABC transporter substrate-binding protein n=1 Tax=Thermobacillus sp. ZCTH02-B1 TaxID=1858795 RepID=UPI000B56156A|nr:sugar ABC transporter substrate-binding protein [Thermobacillus sp. ZCTH02-B1]OUM95743.1 MAG: sugar-binding protein [Thermobacillus sp. ZCTH02-B1]
MRTRLKAFAIILLSAVFVLGLAACGGGKSNGNGESAGGSGNTAQSGDSGSGETVEIRFTWWGDTARNDLYNAIVDRFEEEYPHIKVKREFGGWADYWDRLATQSAGGNAPDVVSMHQFYVADYAARGALLDLQTVIDSGELDVSLFPEAALDSGRVNGTLVMIPKGITMPGWVYHTATLDKLGIAYPDINWTYDDLIAISRQVVEKSGGTMWGTPDMGGGQLQPNFRYFVRQNGEDLYTEDGKLGFSRDTLVKWWSMWKQMRDEKLIPDAATSAEYDGVPLEQNLFVTGKVALYQIPANQIYLYEQQFPEGEIHMVRMPSLPGGQNGEYLEGAYLSITAQSKHPKEAALFINFFVNSERSLELFKVEQGSPANTDMAEFVKPLLAAPQARAVDFIQTVIPYATSAAYAPAGATEVEAAFKDNATAIAFGQKTVEQAADDFLAAANRILGQ